MDRQKDRGTAVGTDVACTWTKPRKESVPVKVEDLDFRQKKNTPRRPGPLPRNYTPLRNITNSDIANIQKHLSKVITTLQCIVIGKIFVQLCVN